MLSAFALAGAVFLIDVPLHLSYPELVEALDDREGLAWGVLAVPLVGLAYVVFAWPGQPPVTLEQGTQDPAVMAQWKAWSSHYDLVEDAAMWFLVASLGLAVVSLVFVQSWRALRSAGEPRRWARRMLGQAFAGPAAWLLAAGLVAGVAMLGVSSLASPLAFASGLLFEPGLPASFLLLGPMLWARDLLESRPASDASGEARPGANPS